MKTCPKCRENETHGAADYCKQCISHINAAHRKTPGGFAAHVLGDARRRAAAKGLAFDLDRDWFLSKLKAGVCEATGLPLTLTGVGRRSALSPSIDRINSQVGYTKNNTQVVAWIYNRSKGQETHDAVLMLARAVCTKENSRG